MPILALTRYERLGSSSRVRFYQYFPYLQSNGLDIVNEPFFTDEYVRALYGGGRQITIKEVTLAYLKRINCLLKSRKFDLLWVEKEFLPWLPSGIESLFRSHKIPYVVDYDDAVFHRYDMHPNPLVRAVLGDKIDQVMKHAEMVIVGNEYLADRATKAGARRIEYLPSVVDIARYEIKIWKQDNSFKVGWIGSPVTAPYLKMAQEALERLGKESKIQLVLVGAGESHTFPNIPTEKIPWSEDIELSISRKFDVGIMPLPDEPFERGKCGYKLIQYMAGGIPVVASPVGINQQIVEPGVNGYLANSMDDWLTALRALRDDPQKRYSMGTAGRQKAEKLYNLQVTAPKLLGLLLSATKH
jgi:glycosyltransferase involved in cell wall biosynthesis